MKRALFALASLLCTLAPAPVHAGASDRTLEIFWVDVEGGGATLIVTPAGESVLIDAGNPFERDPARIAKVAKEVAGLKKIDHLVITHFHIDHFGGAAELSALIPIGTVHDKGLPDTDPDGRPDLQRWVTSSAPYRGFTADARRVIRAGDRIELKQTPGSPALSLRCLAANQQFSEAPTGAAPNPLAAQHVEKPKDPSDNANSLALVLEFGGFRFFDGGDLTWNVEAGLVSPVNRAGVVDVYQVNHHGLDVSNNPMLVHSLAPTVAVMNNGPKKGTAIATMATLKASPGLQALFQLHKNVRPGDGETNTPDEFIANIDEQCAANLIRLGVTPDARRYSISIPATKFTREFAVKNP